MLSAAVPRAGSAWSIGQPIPDDIAGQLLRRSDEESWVADVRMAAGSGDAVIAPARHAGGVIGFVVASEEPTFSAGRLRTAVVEVARVAGAWLGPFALAERDQAQRRVALRRESEGVGVVFQPIVRLAADHRPVGYEALARFEGGGSPIMRFAEAAALGVSTELELAVIQRALASAESLPADRWLSINVSAALLLEVDPLADLLAGTNRDIVLELTEQQPVTDYAAIRASLARLGPRVRLALDDMGEAFSGLRHLVELAPAFAKLDLGLVRDVDADPVRQALVAGLRQYALQTGAELIAEGVESVAEARTLDDLGVTLAQGYLFGRPAPVEHLLLERSRGTAQLRRLRPPADERTSDSRRPRATTPG